MSANIFTLSHSERSDLLTIKDASDWATRYLKKKVTTSNISYLVQYGRINKIGDNGQTLVDKNDLIRYYTQSYNGLRELEWKKHLGDDLNWALSFDHLKESDTTKHIHRLHPYKGKFIPQLVEYFLDGHTDDFKKKTYFKKGDIVLDPFAGSGTTLVQCNEMGMHAIGIDISAFNSLISNVKLGRYDLFQLRDEINRITVALKNYLSKTHTLDFEVNLLEELYKFNNKYFPVPEYKHNLQHGLIDEESYGRKKEKEFLTIYWGLIKKHNIKLRQNDSRTFLDKWYIQHVRDEIEFVFKEIKKIINGLTTGATPNKMAEVALIRRAVAGTKINRLGAVKVDLFLQADNGELFLFDLKTAKPNISNFKDFKRTLLEWAGIILTKNPAARVNTLIAIPYNPYVPRPYERWTLMHA